MLTFRKLAILGGGLLGSSFAAALKKRNLCEFANVWSRSESTRALCKKHSFYDNVCDTIKEAVKDADFILCAVNPSFVPEVLKEAAKYAKTGSIFTDVASTKFKIFTEAEKIFEGKDFYFVASHPMAGSEKSGPEFADANLFEGASCFVCAGKNLEAVNLVIEIWKALNMKVFEVSAKEHDLIVANVSHTPQAAASALAVFASKNEDWFLKFSGKGFKDTSRLAKSDVDMWLSIFKENSQNVSLALKEYILTLSKLEEAISKQDEKSITEFLTLARQTRLKQD